MGANTELVVLVFALHLVGLGLATLLLVVFARSENPSPERDSDEGEDGGGGNERRPPRDSSGPGGGGVPLPDAIPARVRLRAPGRLGELVRDRQRRPVRDPRPLPRRPVRTRS